MTSELGILYQILSGRTVVVDFEIVREFRELAECIWDGTRQLIVTQSKIVRHLRQLP